MSQPITVLLADDHHLVRRGFRRLLEDDPGLRVIGEASSGDEAIALAEALQPQVVVMDCALPGASGLVATRRILETHPSTTVVMLSMHAEQTLVTQALDAGARGYILKSALDLDLASAVKRIAAGDTVQKGQEVGRSGITGLAGGDHLHFTMLLQGQMINPIEWWDPKWTEDRVLRKLRAVTP